MIFYKYMALFEKTKLIQKAFLNQLFYLVLLNNLISIQQTCNSETAP
jgi:hypothetical protein